MQVRRTASGHLYADKAEISKCDMMAGNGVVLQVVVMLIRRMEMKSKMEIRIEDGCNGDVDFVDQDGGVYE